MPRRKRHDDHENLERWLVSYADFITLLFAFFVVMYAISSVNEGKYRVLSDTLTDAFHSQPRTLQPVQVGDEGVTSEAEIIDMVGQPPDAAASLVEQMQGGEGEGGDNLETIADDFHKALAPLIERELINVTRDDLWVEVEINSSLLYTSGSSELEDEAIPILGSLAAILKRYPNEIQVEGFTDNLPISTYLFPSNWELSAARAAGVVSLFMRNGVKPARMSAIGYGEHQPIADNATAEGRRKNRRVVVVILSQKMARRKVGNRAGTATGGAG